MEKIIFNEDEFNDAVMGALRETYDFSIGFKVQLSFFKDGTILNSGLISKNTEIYYKSDFAFSVNVYTEGESDNDETPDDVVDSVLWEYYQNNFFDEIKEIATQEGFEIVFE